MPESNNKTVISIKNITKNYGKHRGNFDISFDIHEHDTIGLIGENGSGKTTLIRQIMGFVKPDSGHISIYNHDAYKEASYCKNFIGYVPGEINFPDVKSGELFLHEYGKKLGVNDFTYANTLIKRLQLDVTAYPKRMSKGMKQKTAIVSALMLQAPIAILDEPTTGLDPLMRNVFLDIIEEQQKKGATILMSSNTIEELERVCTKYCFISKGIILGMISKEEILNAPFRDYEITFNSNEEFKKFLSKKDKPLKINEVKNELVYRINDKDINSFLTLLNNYDVKFLNINPYTISTFFDEKRVMLSGGGDK